MKPVTEDINGDKVLGVQIAHIRAARPDGPRYVAEMSDHDRRRFGNLILLCSTHHNIVDIIEPEKYSIDTLEQWKLDREGNNFEVLKDVPSPDECRLQSLIKDSFREQNKILAQQVTRFEDALTKLAAIDADAAGILRQRMSTANRELEAANLLLHTQDSSLWMREAGQLLAHTQDTSLWMREAGELLAHTQDSSLWMREAGQLLAHTEDTSVRMHEAGQLLAHTEDTSRFLLQAARDLQGLEDRAAELRAAAGWQIKAAQDIQSAADLLMAIDRRLEDRINELRNMGYDY